MSRALLVASVVAAVAISLFAQPSEAVLGVDVSSAVMPDTWKCLKSNGFDYAIIRAWQSNGVPDPNAPHTIYNAWDGGMDDVDIYLFPCYRCGDPAGQVSKLVDSLAGFNITNRSPYGPPHTYGMLWFDIEGPQYWSSSVADNVNFLRGMIAEGQRLGLHMGVYSSESQWNPIMGGENVASNLPLWYPHYDGSASFSDFSPFGGWSKPAIKQFDGTSSRCGAGVDLNWYP